MLKRKLFIVLLFSYTILSAQDSRLADSYFYKGEFEKAANLYEKEYNKQKHSTYKFAKLIKAVQAMEDFEKAENLIKTRLNKFPQKKDMWVSLGYNFDLQHLNDSAKVYYQKALEELHARPTSSYQIARNFLDSHLLDYALDAYLTLKEAIPNGNYNYQIASIYGEKGNVEKMFSTYLDMISDNGGSLPNIKRFIGKYVTDDDLDENNQIFRKLLIKRLQNNPQDEWNKLLSWLYLQQKDYSKALRQEIAVYKRGNSDFDGIIDLGKMAFDNKDYETAQQAFQYILGNTTDVETKVASHFYLLECLKKTEKELEKVEAAYQNFFEEYGKTPNTIGVQVSYARFLAFDKNQPDKAVRELKQSLKNRLNRFDKAEIKILLADILVFTGKYNQALISYSQVQTQLPGHPLAQEARFKVAKTSYYKGDFDWANIQLKVLKRGTSNLISNDALDLSLLIDDNKGEDSLHIPLKTYAKADLLAYQNKNKQAIDTLNVLLKNFKGQAIEDEALFKQAALYKKTGAYTKAEENYLKILSLEENDILIDDALYNLAQLYDNELQQPEKAKTYYEKIVLEQAASIYLVPARKRYRILRGDRSI